MKKANRFLALIISFSIIISTLALSAFAFGGTATGSEEMNVTVAVDKTDVSAGETVKVSVIISNNYNAANMRWPVLFDNSVFELGTEAETAFTTADFLTPGTMGINLSIDTQTAIGTMVKPSGFSVDAYDAVLIQWVAGSTIVNGVTTMNCFNSSERVVCFTFNLKVKADLVGPEAIEGSIFIPSEATTFYYMAMNNVTDATTIYTMNKETCSMTFDDAQVVVKFLNPEIVALQDSVVIDYDNGVIYGLAEVLSTLEDYVEVTDGYIEYLESPDSYISGYQGVVGTGTYIECKGNDGTNLGEFFVVIFGDYNGDGLVDSEDSSYFEAIANYEIFDYIDLTYLYMACDVNGDGSVDAMDAADIASVVNYKAYIDQSLTENRVINY